MEVPAGCRNQHARARALPTAFTFYLLPFTFCLLPFVIEHSLPQQNPSFVRKTFAAIADRYDLANHLLSGGMDFLWRKIAARMVAQGKPSRILDLATGSGDLALALARNSPQAQIVAADFCLPMLRIAQGKNVPTLIHADGLGLPFREASFDVVTVAFGLRNMASWEHALREIRRVLRPGGMILVMDFSLPAPPLRGPYRLYLHNVLPRLAAAITGNREAYEYLGASIESFPRNQGMRTLMTSAGFTDVEIRPLCLGVAAINTTRRAD